MDCNVDMLVLLCEVILVVVLVVGFDNVCFVDGVIEVLDVFIVMGEFLIVDGLIDVVLSNCVFNLVNLLVCDRFLVNIYWVLVFGGCVVISDIVCD